MILLYDCACAIIGLQGKETFTRFAQRAYMGTMSLPALKEQFELLAAETQTRSQDVTRAAEVVSITIGKLVRDSGSLSDKLHELRVLFLTVAPELRVQFEQLENDGLTKNDIASCATIMATMKRFRRRIARPYLEDVDGGSSLKNADRMESLKTNTAADGRTARRLAKRVREAAEDCEKSRIRFVAMLDEEAVRFDVLVRKNFDPDDFRHAYVAALSEQSIKRFPVVNAYLAR